MMSKTSMTQTPMACSPWLIRTRFFFFFFFFFFESLGSFSDSSKKQIFRDI